jgi:hypothetical protein
VEPGGKAAESAGRIRVNIQRAGAPRRFNEFVHVYAADQTNTPVASIYISGEMLGEVSLSPEALYWSVPEGPTKAADRSEASVLRRVTIQSTDGKAIKVKNPQSTIKGLKVEIVPKAAGNVYELVARLEEVPPGSVAGNVSFETSVAAQPRIEVPVIVNVFKP